MSKRVLRSYSAWTAGTALVLSLAQLASANAEPAARPFAPSQSPLLLTRSLHRPLPDGKEVVTRRSYAVRITRVAEGYRVDGTLVDVVVEAPPILAALADIERQRPDGGLFPIMLDAQGMIQGSSAVQADGSLDRAAKIAAGQIGESGLAAVDMLQAQAFIQQLRSRSARSQWPAEVFHPALGSRSETRSVALPGGNAGQVTITINSLGAGPGGRIAALDRTVTTDLAGSKRVTRESWLLSRMAANQAR